MHLLISKVHNNTDDEQTIVTTTFTDLTIYFLNSSKNTRDLTIAFKTLPFTFKHTGRNKLALLKAPKNFLFILRNLVPGA